jgi:hypothetical protein
LYSIYTTDPWAKSNITKTVKKFCEIHDKPYNDAVRRKGSYILADGFKNDIVEQDGSLAHQAKILLFDLETSPILARVWSLWQDGINIDDIVEDWTLLCFSAKWLFSEDVIAHVLTEEELINRDDKRIVTELWKLMDEADIIIGQNSNSFDIKKLNFSSSGDYSNDDLLTHNFVFEANRKTFKMFFKTAFKLSLFIMVTISTIIFTCCRGSFA